MLPTFTVDGDWILCDNTHRYGRGVGVGDLVVYRIPVFQSQWGVKRVMGMPGDYVSVGTPGDKGEELMMQVSLKGYFCDVVADMETTYRSLKVTVG